METHASVQWAGIGQGDQLKRHKDLPMTPDDLKIALDVQSGMLVVRLLYREPDGVWRLINEQALNIDYILHNART